MNEIRRKKYENSEKQIELEYVEHCHKARGGNFRRDDSHSQSKRLEVKSRNPSSHHKTNLNKKPLKIKTCSKLTSRSNSRSLKWGTVDTDESHLSDFFSPNLPVQKRNLTRRLCPVQKDCSLEEGLEKAGLNPQDLEGVTRASLAHLKSKFSMYAKDNNESKQNCASISPVASVKPGLLSQLKQLKSIVQSTNTFEIDLHSKPLHEFTRLSSPQTIRNIVAAEPELHKDIYRNEKNQTNRNSRTGRQLKVEMEQLIQPEETKLRKNTPRASETESRGYLLQRTPLKGPEKASGLFLASAQNQGPTNLSLVPNEPKVAGVFPPMSPNGIRYLQSSSAPDGAVGGLLTAYFNQVGKTRQIASNGVDLNQRPPQSKMGSLVPILCQSVESGDLEASTGGQKERKLNQADHDRQSHKQNSSRGARLEAVPESSTPSSKLIRHSGSRLQVTKLQSLSYFASKFSHSDQLKTEASQNLEKIQLHHLNSFDGGLEKDTAQATTQKTEEPNFEEYFKPSFKLVSQRDSVLDVDSNSKHRKQILRVGPKDQTDPSPVVRKVAENVKECAHKIRIEVTPASEQRPAPMDGGNPRIANEDHKQKAEDTQHLSFANLTRRDDCSEMVLLNQNESRLPNQNTSKNSGKDGLLSSVNQRSVKEEENITTKFKSVPFQLIRNRKPFNKGLENSKIALCEETDRLVFKKSKSMNQLTSVRPKPSAYPRESQDNSLNDIEPEENLAALQIDAFKDDMALSSLKMNSRAKQQVGKPKRNDSELEQVYYTDSSDEETLQKVKNLPLGEQPNGNFVAPPFKKSQQQQQPAARVISQKQQTNKNSASFQPSKPAAANNIKFDLRRVSESSINPSKNLTVSDYRRSKGTGGSYNKFRGAIHLQLSRRSDNETFRERSVSGWRRSHGGTSGKHVTGSYES